MLVDLFHNGFFTSLIEFCDNEINITSQFINNLIQGIDLVIRSI